MPLDLIVKDRLPHVEFLHSGEYHLVTYYAFQNTEFLHRSLALLSVEICLIDRRKHVRITILNSESLISFS